MIDAIMATMGLEYDAITDIVASDAKSCDPQKKHSPYIRVCDTSWLRRQKIIRALRKANIGMDTEQKKLNGFIPAEMMRANYKPPLLARVWDRIIDWL
jgi:hypothetical protein